MLFRRTALFFAGEPAFRDVQRLSWPTAAHPPGFAPPVEAREEDEAFVVLFHVPGGSRPEVRISVESQTVFVRLDLAERAERAFVLPSALAPDAVAVEWNADVVTIVVPKAAGASSRKLVLVRRT